MKNLNVPVSEFLRPFFNPSDQICLRIFADRKEGILFKGMKLETTLSGIDALLPTLHSHNAMNRGIYFVVNAGGHEDSEIERINAHFMECDDLSLEEQWAKIQAFPLPPSIVVRTRKSLHTYWLVRNASVKDFRRIQRELAEHFGGDRTCINESRVLRLPGFNHCKQEPIMVTCVKFNPELTYTQEQLEQHLPRLADTQTAPMYPPQSKQAGLEAVLGRCAFMKHCRDNAATLSEHDWYSMITNLAVFDGGEKAIHGLSAKYPRYNAAETQQKIEHFLQSNTKPITCATIADKGFQCPRRLDGSCSCKAPAAMCYLPLSLDELREALQIIPVKRIPADDVRAAKQFIEKHLYNVPSLDASTPELLYEHKRFRHLVKKITVPDDIHHYIEHEVIPVGSAAQALEQVSVGQRGALYTTLVTQIKQYEKLARAKGFNPLCLWSPRNTDHIMTTEQEAARQYILKEEEVPDQYDLLIFNGSGETCINIRSHMDFVIVNTTDETHITQARGRYRADLEKLYVLDRENAVIVVPDTFMNRWLFKEDKQALRERLAVKNDKGLVPWKDLEGLMTASGYTITKGTRVNNRPRIMISKL